MLRLTEAHLRAFLQDGWLVHASAARDALFINESAFSVVQSGVPCKLPLTLRVCVVMNRCTPKTTDTTVLWCAFLHLLVSSRLFEKARVTVKNHKVRGLRNAACRSWEMHLANNQQNNMLVVCLGRELVIRSGSMEPSCPFL